MSQMELMKGLLDLAAVFISVGTFIWMRFTSPGRAALDKVDKQEERIARLEGEVAHMPDKDSAHRMEMAIARLEGRLETMDERLKPVASMAARMQDYLMETGK